LANVWVYTQRDVTSGREERRPEKMMDALRKRARARNLGARGGGGCSVQLAHHQCRGSPSPPPTHPRRAAPAAIPSKYFQGNQPKMEASSSHGPMLPSCSRVVTLPHCPRSENLLSNRIWEIAGTFCGIRSLFHISVKKKP